MGRGKDSMFSRAWGSGWRLKPETAADVEQESTIQGMRQRIYKFSRENSMVDAILMSAQARGLSGEDTMTWLAYETLKRVETLEELSLEHVRTHITPMVIEKV